MTSGKSPQRDKASQLLVDVESVLCDTLRNHLRRGDGEEDADRDIRGPKSRYIAQRPCVPNAR